MPKKGIRPLKSTVARLPLVVNILAHLVLALGALKAILKATIKGVMGKKAPPKAGIITLKQLTRKINKRWGRIIIVNLLDWLLKMLDNLKRRVEYAD